jgi:hypothetical protein
MKRGVGLFLFALVISLGVVSSVIPDDMLFGYFTFDGASFASTVDVKNVDEIGRCGFPSCPVFEEGKIGNAVKFDGDNDYLDLDVRFPDSRRGSISLWLKSDLSTATLGSYIFSDEGGAMYLKFYGNDKLYFYIDGTSCSSGSIISNALDWEPNNWHHVVVTWGSSSEDPKIYVDNVESVSSSSGSFCTSNSKRILGANKDRQANFDGSIDELRIYSQVLNAGEVDSLFKEEFVSTPVPTPVPNPINVCTDTDTSDDEFVKGTATLGGETKSDHCVLEVVGANPSLNTRTEVDSCDSFQSEGTLCRLGQVVCGLNIVTKYGDCERGCGDGVCVPASVPQPITLGDSPRLFLLPGKADDSESWDEVDTSGYFWKGHFKTNRGAASVDSQLDIKDFGWVGLFGPEYSVAFGVSNSGWNENTIPLGFEADDWKGQFWSENLATSIDNEKDSVDPGWVALFAKDEAAVLVAGEGKNRADWNSAPEGYEWKGQFWIGGQGFHIKGERDARDYGWVGFFVKKEIGDVITSCTWPDKGTVVESDALVNFEGYSGNELLCYNGKIYSTVEGIIIGDNPTSPLISFPEGVVVLDDIDAFAIGSWKVESGIWVVNEEAFECGDKFVQTTGDVPEVCDDGPEGTCLDDCTGCMEGFRLHPNSKTCIPEKATGPYCQIKGIANGKSIMSRTRVKVSGNKIKYCDPETLEFVTAKEKDDSCTNDYECRSNVCIDEECTTIKEELKEQGETLKEIRNTLKKIWCFLTHVTSTRDCSASPDSAYCVCIGSE